MTTFQKLGRAIRMTAEERHECEQSAVMVRKHLSTWIRKRMIETAKRELKD